MPFYRNKNIFGCFFLLTSFFFHAGLLYNYRTIFSGFSAEQLSVDKYVRDRERLRISLQLGSREMKIRNFKKRLQQKHVAPNSIVNDLMHFLHLIDGTADDFALLESALNKFKDASIGDVRRVSIGSILMRMLHHFRNNELASKVNGMKF